ncbi:hypothetical protein G9A89_005674 [Geosiphon pyriformis]|nr:hypothetical protein G9A89_005674 [Geosiphon pyriformis]
MDENFVNVMSQSQREDNETWHTVPANYPFTFTVPPPSLSSPNFRQNRNSYSQPSYYNRSWRISRLPNTILNSSRTPDSFNSHSIAHSRIQYEPQPYMETMTNNNKFAPLPSPVASNLHLSTTGSRESHISQNPRKFQDRTGSPKRSLRRPNLPPYPAGPPVDARKYDFPVVYASTTFETLTGYPSAEIIGRNCRFLQSPDGHVVQGSVREYTDANAVIKLKEKTVSYREVQVDFINYRKGGQPFRNFVTIIPITWDSDEIAYFSIWNLTDSNGCVSFVFISSDGHLFSWNIDLSNDRCEKIDV